MQSIPYLSCLEVTGADAGEFLNAQLSNNVEALNVGDRQLACWCNAKGQVIATFLVIHTAPENFILVLAHSLLSMVSKRLQMYVLRRQVNITVPNHLQLIAPSPFKDAPIWQQLNVISSDTAEKYDAVNVLQAKEINDGLCWLEPLTSEQYLPQMLAMEYHQALDYRKGCYPGQEVIARAHFLGRIKRRLWRVELETPTTDLPPVVGVPIVNTESGIQGHLLASAYTGSAIIGLAILHDNHRDTVLSYEVSGSYYKVSTLQAIGETEQRSCNV